MSLEAALAENTAALNRVAALLEQSNAGREAAVAKLTDATTAGETATRTRAGRKPGAAATGAATTPAPAPTPTPTPEAPKAKTVDDVRAAASTFVSVENEAERAKRKEFLKAVVEHLGCKVVDCAEDDRAKVIGWFEAKGRGEDVSFSDGEDEQPGAEDDDDIG